MSKRDLGNETADKDDRLREFWIDSDELQELLKHETHVVYGAKGAGKTALRRAICEFNGSNYLYTKTVSLADLSFSPAYAHLRSLSEHSNYEIPTLAKSTWMHVLSVFCIEATSQAHIGLEHARSLQRDISQFLHSEGLRQEATSSRFFRQIERFLRG